MAQSVPPHYGEEGAKCWISEWPQFYPLIGPPKALHKEKKKGTDNHWSLIVIFDKDLKKRKDVQLS